MSWLLTHTGKHLDLIDPQPDMIDLIDIAHGLANECRYAGQCLHYYSVAQHSELASRIVPPEYAWAAQPFDLCLPNMNGKTMHGNCDLCFLKGAYQVFSLIRERPERAIWWAHQETLIQGSAAGNGHLFRNDQNQGPR